jgi:predicted metal-dependent peptidase
VECDAAIGRQYRVRKIKDINPEVTGRGGTQLGPGLFEVKKTYNPDVCLAFTDGFTEDINAYKRSDLPKKLIWVVSANGTIDNLNKTGYIVRIPK